MFSKGKSRRSNYHSKRQTFNPRTKTYGKLPIHVAGIDKKHHPHVVIDKHGKNGTWYSVGIQSGSKSGHHKLKQVYESNGEIGYLHKEANNWPATSYQRIAEKWHIDVDSEARAKSMVENYKKNKH